MKKKSLQDKFGLKSHEKVIGPVPRLHEHSNHPDFKFIVEVKNYDEKDKSVKEWIDNTESHALIYCNDSIAITMYEYCFAMWYLRRSGGTEAYAKQTRIEGSSAGISLWSDKNWHLTAKSLKNIKKYLQEVYGK